MEKLSTLFIKPELLLQLQSGAYVCSNSCPYLQKGRPDRCSLYEVTLSMNFGTLSNMPYRDCKLQYKDTLFKDLK